jgi:predicted transcriptional regulator
MDKEVVEKVGKILVSPPKMGIMVTLSKDKSQPFTKIKTRLRQTSGSLNYHLLVLEKERLIKKTKEGKYVLTPEGNKVTSVIKDVVARE